MRIYYTAVSHGDLVSYWNINGYKHSLRNVRNHVFNPSRIVQMTYDEICRMNIVCCHDVMPVILAWIAGPHEFFSNVWVTAVLEFKRCAISWSYYFECELPSFRYPPEYISLLYHGLLADRQALDMMANFIDCYSIF